MVKFKFMLSKDEDINIWLDFIEEPKTYGKDWLKSYPDSFKASLKGKSKKEQKDIVIRYIEKYYTKEYIDRFYNNKEKLRKHKDKIVKVLEKIHNRKFPVKNIIFKYNTFIACPYQWDEKNKDWFGIFLSKKYINKGAIGVAIHELMHLFFHYYFWDILKNKKLNYNDKHFIKESFTVIVNEEFKDILDHKDYGYDDHRKLRKCILNEWKKGKSFEEIAKYVFSNFKTLK